MIDLPADPRIAGDGLILRRWRIADVDPLVEIWQDPELRHRFVIPTTTTPTIEVFVRDAVGAGRPARRACSPWSTPRQMRSSAAAT